MNNNEFSPIIISGPSGAGKTELIEYLKIKNDIFVEAPGITTRKKRIKETSNTDFVSMEEFLDFISHDELLQYSKYDGNYYGTLKTSLGLLKYKQAIFNMGLDGAIALKKIFPESSSIYILPPTKEELIRRMGNRGIERYKLGIEQTKNSIDIYDYLLISYTNDIELMYNDFINIFQNNENSKEKSLKLVKNRNFMQNFYD